MQNKDMMAFVFVMLIGAAAFSAWMSADSKGEASTEIAFSWIGFLYVLPLVVAIFVVTGHRWALMAGVMYGTIGLALDMSTVVHEVTQGQAQPVVLIMSAITGLLNFFLILLGGREFLTEQTLSPR